MEIITVIAVIVTLAAVWWSVGHAQSAREALAAVREELEATKTERDATKAKSKKGGQTDQSALKSELTSVKKDLSQAKKKAHEAQVELKAELERERASRRELEKRLNDSPAFQSNETKTKIETKEAAPEPVTIEAPSQPEAPELASEELTEGERTKTDSLIAKLKNEKGELIETQKRLKRELKDAKYRVERYRRIDLVKQREHELVDDRLLTMGRLYYDAVSENAALKGDVVPPKPRELREAEARAAERAAKEAKAEARRTQDVEDDEQATSISDAMVQEEQAQIEKIEVTKADSSPSDQDNEEMTDAPSDAPAELSPSVSGSETPAAPAS